MKRLRLSTAILFIAIFALCSALALQNRQANRRELAISRLKAELVTTARMMIIEKESKENVEFYLKQIGIMKAVSTNSQAH